MTVNYNNKPFTGVTYNQGAFTGNRAHFFIKGQQQCSYSLNLQAGNRIYKTIQTIANLQKLINTKSACKQCASNVNAAIQQYARA